jgi:hypothetical protein
VTPARRAGSIAAVPSRAILPLIAVLAAAALAPPPALAQSGTRQEPQRRIVYVGPSRTLKTPSQAAAVVKDGDHVKIDAGQYKDCAVWRAGNLILEAVGGVAHMLNVTCEDQAIWLFTGNRVLVKGMEFSGAHNHDNTGAGIKFLGATLTVQDSNFHHNENGLLARDVERSQILIVHSTFTDNGKCEPICAHGIYIGRIAKLTVRRSIFKNQNAGHHIKSRAAVTELNRIEDGLDGTASFLVDLPNGGTALIRNNLFQKGEKAENRLAMISIGEEGHLHPSQGIVFERNSFVNARANLDAFIRNAAADTDVKIDASNSFLGSGAMHLKVIHKAQAKPAG